MAISYVSSAGAQSGSLTLPTHIAGDLLIVVAYRNTNNVIPTAPDGWHSVATRGGGSNALVLACKVAASDSEVSGTWTNAQYIGCAVYRDTANVLNVGNFATLNQSNLNVIYSGVTGRTSMSWFVAVAGYRGNDTDLETPPTGMVNRLTFAGTDGEIAIHDTDGEISAWSSQTVNLTGTSLGWQSAVAGIIDLGYPKSSGGGNIIIIED